MNQRINIQPDEEGDEEIPHLAQETKTEKYESGEVEKELNDTAKDLHAVLDPETEEQEWRDKLKAFVYIKDPAEQRRFVTQNYERIIESFEAAFSKRGLDYDHSKALERLMESDHRWLGKDIMSSLLMKISEEVKESGSMYFFDDIVKIAVRNGNRNAFDLIEMYLGNRINLEDEGNPKAEMRGFLANVLTNKETPPHVAERAEKIILNYLDSLGMSGRTCLRIWKENFKGSTKDNIGASIAAQLYSIGSLEKRCPGAAAYLCNECGIYFFRRYNLTFLKELYEEREDQEKPYGVVFYPYDDHNGAFTKDDDVLENLKKELSKYGYTLRLAEIGNLGSLNSMTNKFHERGGEREIAFAIFGGHGTKDTIQLGSNETYNSGKFTESLQRVRPLFAEDAQLILVSCSTGTSGGLASKVAGMKGGFNTVGPNAPTNVREITVSMQDGKLTLDPEYYDPQLKRSYAKSA